MPKTKAGPPEFAPFYHLDSSYKALQAGLSFVVYSVLDNEYLLGMESGLCTVFMNGTGLRALLLSHATILVAMLIHKLAV